MHNLIRAEVTKALKNRWATLFTVFMFPMGVALFFIFVLGSELAGVGITTEFVEWQLIINQTFNFPNSFFGQLFLVAFGAFVFAGEAVWGTWKNIIPRNARVRLILAKYIAVAVLVFLSLNLMGLIAFIGAIVLGLITGAQMQPAFGTPAAWAFMSEYVLNMVTVFATSLLAAGYAALAALFTRSILGGAVIGMLVAFSDFTIATVVSRLNSLVVTFDFAPFIRILPAYNILNIQNWLQTGRGWRLTPAMEPPSAFESLLVASAWATGVVIVSILAFRQRDIA